MTKPPRKPAPPPSVFVEIDGRMIEADARPDLGRGIYAAWVEIGGDDAPRYYRLDGPPDCPVPVDVTAQVSADLAARQRRADERLEREQRESEARIRRAESETSRVARSRHGDVVEELSDRAGVKRLRTRSPIQYLQSKELLTGRQFSAGQALYEDSMLAQMVRQPAEAGGGGGFENGGSAPCFESAALEAAARLDRVCMCCDQLDRRLWPVVRAVAIQERTATEVASSAKSRDRAAIMLALRAGLDVAGDCYGMPSDYVTVHVTVGSHPAPMELAQDHRELWRARSLNGRPWIAEGKTASDVFKLARAEMRARVDARIGAGAHPPSVIAKAMVDDRREAVAAGLHRASSERDRADGKVKDVAAERARVVRR